MIPVRQLLHKLDLKLNKLATSANQSIDNSDKIFALNEGQLKLIKKKVGSSNNYQLGLDAFKKRYQDLQNLIVYYEDLPVQKTSSIYHSYKTNLLNTKSKLMFPISLIGLANKGECKNRIINIPRIIKHGDITTFMGSSHYKPSFEWQETIAEITNNDLIAYTDSTFSITSLQLSYLKYPQPISISGYYDLYGNPTVDQDCELEDYLEDELLDFVVLDLALSTENPNAVQASDIRIKTNE